MYSNIITLWFYVLNYILYLISASNYFILYYRDNTLENYLNVAIIAEEYSWSSTIIPKLHIRDTCISTLNTLYIIPTT